MESFWIKTIPKKGKQDTMKKKYNLKDTMKKKNTNQNLEQWASKLQTNNIIA